LATFIAEVYHKHVLIDDFDILQRIFNRVDDAHLTSFINKRNSSFNSSSLRVTTNDIRKKRCQLPTNAMGLRVFAIRLLQPEKIAASRDILHNPRQIGRLEFIVYPA
jgi:hypothetical protein